MKATKPERSFIIKSISKNALVGSSSQTIVSRVKRRSIRPSRSISVLKSVKPIHSNIKSTENL